MWPRGRAARSGDAAREFANRYGAHDAHAGYEALYNNPDVDAVYVATPHTLLSVNNAI